MDFTPLRGHASEGDQRRAGDPTGDLHVRDPTGDPGQLGRPTMASQLASAIQAGLGRGPLDPRTRATPRPGADGLRVQARVRSDRKFYFFSLHQSDLPRTKQSRRSSAPLFFQLARSAWEQDREDSDRIRRTL
jgi:hypothetical protein